MISLLLMLALAQTPCERVAGTPQCAELRYNTVDHLWRGRASCYVKDNKDGGFTAHPIKCGPAESKEACQAELDTKASHGCQQ